MIPYDDLVAALSAWRARQGLPVSTMGGGGSSAAPQTGTQGGSGGYSQSGSGGYSQSGSGGYSQSGSYGKPGSGPYGQPGSGPQRSKPASIPPPAPMPMEEVVDEAEMIDEYADEGGGDFGMSFGGQNEDGDETAIGGAPDRPTDPNDFGNGRGGRGNW